MSIDYYVAPCHPPLSTELLDLLSQTETATIGHVEHVGFVGDAILPVFPARVAGQALTIAARARRDGDLQGDRFAAAGRHHGDIEGG